MIELRGNSIGDNRNIRTLEFIDHEKSSELLVKILYHSNSNSYDILCSGYSHSQGKLKNHHYSLNADDIIFEINVSLAICLFNRPDHTSIRVIVPYDRDIAENWESIKHAICSVRDELDVHDVSFVIIIEGLRKRKLLDDILSFGKEHRDVQLAIKPSVSLYTHLSPNSDKWYTDTMSFEELANYGTLWHYCTKTNPVLIYSVNEDNRHLIDRIVKIFPKSIFSIAVRPSKGTADNCVNHIINELHAIGYDVILCDYPDRVH